MTSCSLENFEGHSQNGRTWRRRRKKKNFTDDSAYSVDWSPALINLSRWLHGYLNNSSLKSKLKPTVFPETGRGLMTLQRLKAGDVIVSVPRKVMVTCDDVFKEELIANVLKDSKTKFRAMEVLSLFLVLQRSLGGCSKWKPYIDSLPSTYNVPSFCHEKEIKLMPDFLKCIVEKQKKDVFCCYTNTKETFFHLQNAGVLDSLPTLLDIQWAWFTVNTRAVYLKNNDPGPLLVDEDVYALVPYLDLLNHSYTAQVEAYLSERSGCYEIKTLIPFRSYEQVFINYGPHDNIKLYSEYGFLLSDNAHNSVPFTTEEILAFLKDFVNGEDFKARKEVFYEKQKLILSQNINNNLAMSPEGPSWNLEVLVTIFLMTSEELRQWQVVYQDLLDICYRHLVLQCLRMLCKDKLASFSMSLSNMNDLGTCTEAFLYAKDLIKECCSILTNALDCIK